MSNVASLIGNTHPDADEEERKEESGDETQQCPYDNENHEILRVHDERERFGTSRTTRTMRLG